MDQHDQAADIHSANFRRQREASWRRLERLLNKVKDPLQPMSPSELAELPQLYRVTLSSLSVSRKYVLDRRLTEYLEALAQRAYLEIYAPREHLRGMLGRTIVHDFPRAIRGMGAELIIALMCLVIGTLAGRAIVLANPDLFYGLVSESMANGRGPDANREEMMASIYSSAADPIKRLQEFAFYLAHNNTAVALLAFGLGLAFGVPTIMLLLYNGAILGAMIAAFEMHDLGVDFVAWLSIHGVTELTAIAIAGAGGLKIAHGMLFPDGRETRFAAAKRHGIDAGVVLIGAFFMLAIAAVLEAFARQLIQPMEQRYAIAALTAVLWLAYFSLAGRSRKAPRGTGSE